MTYANKVNAGLAASPTIPMFIGQGTAGALDGTFSSQVGDGVMMAYDVRARWRKFCASGTPVTYNEYPLEHAGAIVPWGPACCRGSTTASTGKPRRATAG